MSVLRAIALAETGRSTKGNFLPWPWTVNMEGAGKWFNTGEEALAFVDEAVGRGARSFDLGCFQINYRWHGEAFSSVEEMFDPMANAIYAARFLKTLHDELGSWSEAAGAYHSRTPQHADRYRMRFEKLRAGLGDMQVAEPEVPQIVQDAPPPPRVNHYPLLLASGTGIRGSLFATEAGAGRQPLIGGSSGSLLGSN